MPALYRVPPAHGGEISDRQLTSVIEAADALTFGTLTDAQASLLCMSCAPLLRELEQWRMRAAVARDALLPNNVHMFRAG